MKKTWKHGRFVIRSTMPITCEEKKLLANPNSDTVRLLWRKVLQGRWRIIELGK